MTMHAVRLVVHQLFMNRGVDPISDKSLLLEVTSSGQASVEIRFFTSIRGATFSEGGWGGFRRLRGSTLQLTNMEVKKQLFVKESSLPRGHVPLPCS